MGICMIVSYLMSMMYFRVIYYVFFVLVLYRGFLEVLVSLLYARFSGRVSCSGFPTRDFFEKILHEIPCVNSFPLFIYNINFKFSI